MSPEWNLMIGTEIVSCNESWSNQHIRLSYADAALKKPCSQSHCKDWRLLHTLNAQCLGERNLGGSQGNTCAGIITPDPHIDPTGTIQRLQKSSAPLFALIAASGVFVS